MKKFTQSELAPRGNCWQTAIACILEVNPDKLPPQSEIEAARGSVTLRGWGMYSNVLNGYLKKHHGLVYTEIQRYQFGCVRPVGEYHTLNGPSVRTEELRKQSSLHINHCVVAKNGEMVWDVHPSRAGLIAVDSWGVLGERQPSNADTQKWEDSRMEDPVYRLVWSCLCPECGLEELREKLRQEALVTDVLAKVSVNPRLAVRGE